MMSHAHKFLYDEIVKLPVDKLGKVLSFVRYLEQETDEDLWLDADYEAELHSLLQSDDFISSAELLAKIREMPDDYTSQESRKIYFVTEQINCFASVQCH